MLKPIMYSLYTLAYIIFLFYFLVRPVVTWNYQYNVVSVIFPIIMIFGLLAGAWHIWLMGRRIKRSYIAFRQARLEGSAYGNI